MPPSALGQPATIAARLVPDDLWHTIQPLLPAAKLRPQGGGARRNDDRPLLVAVVYVVTTGAAWRKIPPWCGVTHASAHRRFTEWTAARVWNRLLDTLGPGHGADCWCRAIAALALAHAADQPLRQVHRRHTAPTGPDHDHE
jgi:transposase